jgi:hypothetical protein
MLLIHLSRTAPADAAQAQDRLHINIIGGVVAIVVSIVTVAR